MFHAGSQSKENTHTNLSFPSRASYTVLNLYMQFNNHKLSMVSNYRDLDTESTVTAIWHHKNFFCLEILQNMWYLSGIDSSKA
jgi:hypothetical protein